MIKTGQTLVFVTTRAFSLGELFSVLCLNFARGISRLTVSARL